MAKQIEICAKVIDDAEWEKVLEGVYTGFSQGGAYERRWTDATGSTRYAASPNEISLVDLPCLPQATFEMIKADGTSEQRRFGKGLDNVARLTRAISKVEDGGGDSHSDVEKLLSNPEALSVLAIKLAQRNGRSPFR